MTEQELIEDNEKQKKLMCQHTVLMLSIPTSCLFVLAQAAINSDKKKIDNGLVLRTVSYPLGHAVFPFKETLTEFMETAWLEPGSVSRTGS